MTTSTPESEEEEEEEEEEGWKVKCHWEEMKSPDSLVRLNVLEKDWTEEADVMEEVGLVKVENYVSRLHNRVAQFITTRRWLIRYEDNAANLILGMNPNVPL